MIERVIFFFYKFPVGPERDSNCICVEQEYQRSAHAWGKSRKSGRLSCKVYCPTWSKIGSTVFYLVVCLVKLPNMTKSRGFVTPLPSWCLHVDRRTELREDANAPKVLNSLMAWSGVFLGNVITAWLVNKLRRLWNRVTAGTRTRHKIYKVMNKICAC